MEMKEELIKRLERRIEAQNNIISENICTINEAVNEILCSLDIKNYLSFLKEDLIKNDEG